MSIAQCSAHLVMLDPLFVGMLTNRSGPHGCMTIEHPIMRSTVFLMSVCSGKPVGELKDFSHHSKNNENDQKESQEE